MKDVRFADDQGMVASTQNGLQRLMDRVNEASKRYGMKINVKKTKTMIVSCVKTILYTKDKFSILSDRTYVLKSYLPNVVDHGYNLRSRPHNFALPIKSSKFIACNFICRMLYKECY